jgi:hypothetical protein
MPATMVAEASRRCLGAPNPWVPFVGGGGGAAAAAASKQLGLRRRRRGRALREEAGGDGNDADLVEWLAAAAAGGVDGGEAGEAGWRDADGGGTGMEGARDGGIVDTSGGDIIGGVVGGGEGGGQGGGADVGDGRPGGAMATAMTMAWRRQLLAARYRLPPGKYKPLAPKCAASERVKREVRSGEDSLLACLGKAGKCKDAAAGEVFAAAAALPGLRAVKAPAKCIIVNSVKGCTSIADNPETVPYIGTKPPVPLSADVPRTHRTCALVGNGPGLKGDAKMGRIIDSHDAVFRFNAFSSLGDWVNFTGSKATYRTFNKKRAETMSSSGNQFRKDSTATANEMGEFWVYWNYMSFPYLESVRKANKNTAVMSPDVLRYMTNAYFKMRQDIHRLGFNGFQCPTNVNSGVHATFMAMQMCERVNLFGFSYSMDMLNKRNDARSPRISRFHDWAFDTILLRLLHLGGFVNLCTS